VVKILIHATSTRPQRNVQSSYERVLENPLESERKTCAIDRCVYLLID
jgi:hypothetical protein